MLSIQEIPNQNMHKMFQHPSPALKIKILQKQTKIEIRCHWNEMNEIVFLNTEIEDLG